MVANVGTDDQIPAAGQAADDDIDRDLWHDSVPLVTPGPPVAAMSPPPLADGESPPPTVTGTIPTAADFTAFLSHAERCVPPETKKDEVEQETAIEAMHCREIQLDVLGKIGRSGVKVFSLYHRRVGEIPDVSRLTYEQLLQVAGPPVKRYVLKSPGETKENTASMQDMKAAVALLSGYRNLSEFPEIGAGCWEGCDETGDPTGTVVIVGNGEGAEWNCEFRKIEHPRCGGHLLDFASDVRQWYDPGQLERNLKKCEDVEFRKRVVDELANLFEKWRWKHHESSPVVVASLVLATWVQAIFEWRPQIAIIGETKAGKSVLCTALNRLFGPLCVLTYDATAPGIQQDIHRTSKIIVYDEFDAEDKETASEQRKILKMLRSAGRGGHRIRGSSGQKSAKSQLNQIVWILGIQISMRKAADRNRYIMQELLPPLPHMRNKLSIPSQAELSDLGQRSLAVAIYCIRRAKPLALALKDTHVDGVDSRVIESYAVPAAILGAVRGSTDDETRAYLEFMAKDQQDDSGLQTDSQACMEDILSAQVQIGPARFSVAQLLGDVVRQFGQWQEYEKALESRGLKFDVYQQKNTPPHLANRGCFLIAHRPVLEHLLKNTRWGNQAIDQILLRIVSPDDRVFSRRRIGGQRQYTVAIPRELLEREFLGIRRDGRVFGEDDDEVVSEF